MAVQSDKIKDMVAKVTFIESTGDKTFATDAARCAASQLFKMLSLSFAKSPTFAAVAIQHLTDAGYEIGAVKGEAFADFNERFGARLAKLTDAEKASIRVIALKLFKPYIASSSPA